MSMSPDLELQGAIVARLKADTGIIALVDDRVYETIPIDTPFPYVSYAGSSETEDDADCILGSAISVQIDAWSRTVGFPECKRVCDAVRNALHDIDLELSINALVMIEHRQIRIFRDPDGLTNHGVIEFEAFIERQP